MSLQGRKLHLIGIGGAGMSGLALAADSLGAEVTGSDRGESSYTARLVDAGIKVAIGHDAANLPAGADVVVSTAIPDDNPELSAARSAGATILHRSDLLAELVALRKTCIAVAGTHGKTTTTAMIAHVLHELGENPSFFVGGEIEVGGVQTNAAIGDGEIVVVEADESDGSFLKLDPDVAVITNVELDHHANWSGGLKQLLAAFADYAAGADTVVSWAHQPELAELGGTAQRTFAIAPEQADLAAGDLSTAPGSTEGTEFKLNGREIQLGVRGEHNVLNALAALGALEAAGISIERAAPQLATFRGVGRRFELIGEAKGAAVCDDYAHHPTEVVAALKTARETVEGGRVIAIFQPHLYSRTASLAREFGAALALADVAVVLDIYAAREEPSDHPGVTGWWVATRIADAAPGMPVYWEPQPDDALAALQRIIRPGDLCIFIGAGDIHLLSRRLIEEAA